MATASTASTEDRMRRRACTATIIAVAAPVIAAIIGVEVTTAVVVASQATNHTIIAALTASQLTSLVAREPAVRTEITSLLSDRTSALA
jgi:hypothetical protein